MKSKFILIFVFGILFAACKQEKPLSEFMVDNWQTTYLKIDMPTYKKSDSLFVFEDDFSKLNARIAKSSYIVNGTFNAWYENKENEKITPTKGSWKTVGDSLYIHYSVGKRNVTVGYLVERTEEGFIGKSVYDWDEDGEFDDTLIMKTKRITVE